MAAEMPHGPGLLARYLPRGLRDRLVDLAQLQPGGADQDLRGASAFQAIEIAEGMPKRQRRTIG